MFGGFDRIGALKKLSSSRLTWLAPTHKHKTAWRARLSKRLIEEKGFRFIAMEGACIAESWLASGFYPSTRPSIAITQLTRAPHIGDWPDCFEINKYIKGFHDAAKSPVDIVKHFKVRGWRELNGDQFNVHPDADL